MKHLILSGLVETWPVSQTSRALFVSNAAKPWSTRNHPIFSHSCVHPSIWNENNHARLVELNSISEIFLSSLSKTYSRIFKLDWDDRAWRILLGPFVLVYVHTICDRLWTLESISAANTPYQFISPDFTSFHPLFCDECSLNLSITSDHLLNHYIYTQIINELPRLFDRVFYPRKNANLPPYVFFAKQEQNTDFNLAALNRTIVKSLITTCLSSIKNKRIKLLPGSLSFSDQLNLILGSREISLFQIPSVITHVHKLSYTYSASLRYEIDHIFAQECPLNGSVWLALKLFLGLFLPVSLVEAFSNYCHQHKAIRPRRFFRSTPQTIVSQYGLWWNSAEKLSLAQSVANGAKLVYLQHGGYGSEYFSFFLEHELNCAHLYLSWGLKYHNITSLLGAKSAAFKPQVEPIGFPAPAQFRGLSRFPLMKSSPKFLFICSHWSLYSAINPNCGNIDAFQSSIDSCIDVVSGLTRFKPSSFSVRLCKIDHGIDEEAQWHARAPQVAIIRKHEDLDVHIKLHDLCIYTYNGGSGWCRLLFDETPFVLYFDPTLSPPSKFFEPVMARFDAVGLFHNSPHSLASFIDDHGDSIHEWYSSNDVVEAIVFCKSSFLAYSTKSQYLSNLRKCLLSL